MVHTPWGGLVGQNDGTISGSSVAGEVSRIVEGRPTIVGSDPFGGLVGINSGTITASYATGSVRARIGSAGGLVGTNSGTITASYATSAVSGKGDVGGLVSANVGTISASYATGVVSGSGDVGGLVGDNGSGTISASYATGAVSGSDFAVVGDGAAGGLVGDNGSGMISASYATGAVSGSGDVGGLVSDNGSGTITTSYWDTETSGQSTSAGGVGKTTSELQSPTGYTGIYADWNVDMDGDGTGDDPWDFGTTSEYPVIDYGGLSVSGQRSSDTATPTPTPTATPTSTPDPTPTSTPTTATDYDTDDDGLIEVGSLAQLNAVRWDLDGNGTPATANASDYAAAFPNAATGMGCPSTGCTGYELTTNLDFDTNGNGEADAVDDYWNGGAGWDPIGTFSISGSFTATFEGNGNSISGLFINRPTADFVGLFGGVGILETGTIRNVGVIGVDVTGSRIVGGLVGWSRGTISACYATGAVSGSGDQVGGLAGYNGGTGTVTASYADVTVSGGGNDVGGLVGHNEGTGSITAGYAIGDVSSAGDFVGGLVGANFSTIRASYATGTATGRSNSGGLIGGDVRGTITASYWDTQTSSLSTSAGGVGKTTSELQSPTSNTGIYSTWDGDVWDFGTSSQYPALKGLGLSVAKQRQSHPAAVSSPGAPTIGAVTSGTGSLAISWTAPSSDGGSAITAHDLRHIETTADETDDSNWTVVDDVWTTGGGTLQYTLTGLTGGTQYDLQMRAVNAVGDGPWSATATGTPTAAAATTATDYDTDDDGLIEVGSLAQLEAIHVDLDGDGSPTNSTAYDAAFPNAATGMGCPSTGCTGYELTTNLDFDTNGDGRTDIAGDDYWNDGAGWQPIGTFSISGSFTATFEGNGNSLSGLFINRPTANYVGLFGGVGILGTGTIRNVGVTGMDVTGSSFVGGLAGWSRGTISGSYATGAVFGAGDQVGGLAGYNGGTGTVSASYADVTVSGSQNNVGGLVGHNEGTGSITASYAIGAVSSDGFNVGGLVGANFSGIRASYATGTASGRTSVGGLTGGGFGGTIAASYWDTQTSGLSTSDGGDGKTTAELQSPTSATAIYGTWDDDVWDFGTSSQYPALKGLGLSVAEQRQSHPAAVSPLGAPTIGAVAPGAGTLAITWTAPSSDGGSAITAYDLRHIETSADETVDSNWTMVDDVWATGGGTLQHTLTGLTGGTQYDLQVRAVNAGGDGPWSATATGTPTAAGDYDADDDGLIEVGSLAQLDAIRYDLDGDGVAVAANQSGYATAFPNAADGMGCPSTGCTGYELTTNLDFDTNGNGEADAGDTYWNDGAGWEPIGTFGLSQEAFRATFDGNGNTIAGLFIDRSTSEFVGLFGGAGLYGTGTIRNVGLTGVDVKGRSKVGGLAGWNMGTISASHAEGDVDGEGNRVGGLVGENEGTITASYATGTVSGEGSVGGLVGANFGVISTAYATGAASGSSGVGGLVGINPGRITASYWDTTTSGRSTSGGGIGKTTSELQSPTGYTGIYADWNVDLDGDGTNDDPWDFGTSSQYPVLKVFASGVDETRGPGAPTIDAVTPGAGSLAISWTAPSSDGGSAITAYDLRQIETSADETVDSYWTVVDDVWTTGGGTLLYTLTGLTGGTQYDLQLRAVNAGGDGPWSATATGTPTAAGDYDADDDGLIEVGSLAQLDAIRYDLDGDGSPTNSTAYDAAFPNAATGMGCPSTGCTGYELTTNLDFDTNGDGRTDIAGDDYWNDGAGWEPIGTESALFSATFEGNSNTVSGLFINRPATDYVGLFGSLAVASVVRKVGLTGVDVTGGDAVGGLAGWNRGKIRDCYAEGTGTGGSQNVGGLVGSNNGTITASYATGATSGSFFRIGGLVGANDGTITASYATGATSGSGAVGGLVGKNNSSGTITASYATGATSGGTLVGGLVGDNDRGTITTSYATGMASATGWFSPDGSSSAYEGGLVGFNRAYPGLDKGAITASYWDTETSGLSASAGGVGKTTSELQSPTGYTGIYANWNVDLDGDGTGDDPWDFGTSSQYPALKGPSSFLTDREILEVLYNATDGANWTDNTNWLSDEPLGDWHGVTTDADGRVTRLSLSENLLSGRLPSELGSLIRLQHMDLSSRGAICFSGGCRPTSESANRLIGEIPSELGNLSDLEGLYLHRNLLSGPIPSELGRLSNLRWLRLDANSGLSGPLPGSFTGLTSLERLDLNWTQLCAPAVATFQEWLQGIDSKNGVVDCSSSDLTDREILTALYNDTGGAKWTNNTNWLSEEPLGDWHGVTTDDEGRVTALDLSENQLKGTIPVELGSLSKVIELHLWGNQLTGEIPPALGDLANLTDLFLRGNRLTGCIPAGLQDLENGDLVQLSLPPCWPPGASTIGAVAPGTGTLFVSWTPTWNDGRSRITAYDLRYIETEADETDDSNWTVVDDVWITGGGTLQYTLVGLTGGTQYDLQIRAVNAVGDGPWSESGTETPTTSSACVTGGAVIDATNTGLASDCEALLAWRDTLAGTATLNWSADTPITDWDGIGDDSLEGSPKRVSRLYLDRLRLDGMIPGGLSNLSELRVLYLHDNELTGSIPSSLGDLSNLTDLYAHNNDLTGEIPAELGKLASLQELSLHGNDLNGSIPAELGKLANLTNLLLHDNDLTGKIPAEIAKLSSLESLDIAENNLSGSIPAELGKLTNLVRLGLSDNDLESEIPREIGGLAKLQELYLHQNMLSGQIPGELGQLSELTDLWLNSNYLSGEVPRSLGGLTKLTSFRLAYNDFTGCLPMGLAAVSDSDADQLGLATCGSVTGVTVSSRPAEGDTYALGETIHIRVTFSESVEVTGSPRLEIDMDPAGLGQNWAHYESGSGTSELIFVHKVVEPNLSTQGIAVLANTLELNDGAIKSTATQEDADLSHPGLPHDPAHKVDWR